MKILLAGAKSSEKETFNSLSRRKGHSIVFAEDKTTILTQLSNNDIDMVVLGSNVSTEDGARVIQNTQRMIAQRYIPVLAIATQAHQNHIQAYLDAGIDDFISTSQSELMLDAKIDLLERLKTFAMQNQKEHAELDSYHQHLENDIQIAKVIFSKILKEGCLNLPNINYSLSPNFSFKGELLIAQKKPNNDLCIMLGDFPGYGLQASIGAIPIAEIFYAMIAKGYSLKHLLKELNKRLKAIFPPSIFCRACVVDIDIIAKRAKIWNAGMPDCYIWSKRSGISAVVSAHQFPLGIVDENHFEAQIQEVELDYGDKIYLLSDEILKSQNEKQQVLGREGLNKFFKECAKSENLFTDIQKKVEKYTQSEDAPTLAEITLLPTNNYSGPHTSHGVVNRAHMQDWQFSLELHPVSLREFDPLPLLLDLLMECPDLHDHRGALYTILAELYSNALEHGILKMSSALKGQPNGFAEYYEQRTKKLQELKEGYVRFEIKHNPTKEGGVVEIVIEDSGEGFNYHEMNTNLQKSVLYSGRGIPLIKHLADEIRFEGKGNRVYVKLHFQRS